MKIDLFTKIILTGIFLCLALITLKNYDVIQTARAGKNETVNINIQKFGGHYIGKALPVKLVE